MIAERQNREKNVPRRRKKEKIIKVSKSELNNQYDEDEDDDDDEDKDDESEEDNVKESINVMVETNEVLTVI